MGWIFRKFVVGMLFFTFGGQANAQFSGIYDGSILRGKTGAAGEASSDKVVINPAHAANLPATEVQLSSGLKREEYNQRYPGFDAHTSNDSGLIIPIPALVFKPTSNFGISAIIVPFSINQDISKSDIPIVILDQENSVDFVGSGQLDFLAFGVFGYRFTDSFSAGLQFSYIKASGDFQLLTPGIAEPLATVSASISTISSRVGLLYSVGEILNIGISAGAYSNSTTDLDFQSSLTSIGGEAETPGDNGSSGGGSFLNPIRFGLGFYPTPRVEFALDLEYKRAEPKDEFSITDLKSKPKDVYDTLSVYTGTAVEIRGGWSILAGYFYEPASIGPGSPGPDGKAGFGFTDILLNMGELPSKPQWNLGMGVRKGFGKKKKSGKGLPGYHKLVVEGGFAYGETSIGIGENGEQPGAYLSRRTKFPFTISYRF